MTSGQKKQFYILSLWSFIAIFLFSLRPGIAVACDFVENNEAKGDQGIVIFTTEWCPYCHQTKQFLDSRGENYLNCDVEHSKQGKARFNELGGSSVPLIVIGNVRIDGFDLPALQNALIDLSSPDIQL